MGNDKYEIDAGTAKAFYNYTKDSAESVYRSLDSLNNRLTTLIGFSGLLLRFTIDLPRLEEPKLEEGLKIAIVVFLTFAVLVSSFGLLTYQVTAFYWPDELLDTIEEKDEATSLTYLALSRRYGLEELDRIRKSRSLILKMTIFFMVLAIIGFAVDIVLSTKASAILVT